MQYLTVFTICLGAATATSFQAWSGGQCNGSAGSKVTLHSGGSCEKVDGRNSWTVQGDDVKGVYYANGGCNQAGRSAAFTANRNTCVNINPGFTVGSMCVGGQGGNLNNCA